MFQLGGTFSDGDYFIDCTPTIHQFSIQALFGIWLAIWIQSIIFAIQYMYTSTIVTRLLSSDPTQQKVNLWRVAPTGLFDIFRHPVLITRSLLEGRLFYVIASLICVVGHIVGALSPAITNFTIVTRNVTQLEDISGHLATRYVVGSGIVEVFAAQIPARVSVLEQAGASYDQLFDFVPDDNSGWVFNPEEWNNTWTAKCTFDIHYAVDITLQATNQIWYEDLAPDLGLYLPYWTMNSTPASLTMGNQDNASAWVDFLAFYIFVRAVPGGLNISFANFLVHDVPCGDSNIFTQNTTTITDVNVADCMYVNLNPGGLNQAWPDDGYPDVSLTATTFAFEPSFYKNSTSHQKVVQPTGEQMLRSWQAYVSIKDTIIKHPVSRRLSAVRSITQIRLSVLAATISSFIIALIGVLRVFLREQFDKRRRKVMMPVSQYDWIVHAAREVVGDKDGKMRMRSPNGFQKKYDGMFVLDIDELEGDDTVTWIIKKDIAENSPLLVGKSETPDE